jgi:sulfite reductase beta subunit-like hemoprotein
MRGLARMARAYGNGTLRATNDQNVVLPWIPEGHLAAFHADLVDLELANPDPGTIADVVSCPGMDYCSLAITRSMGVAEHVRAHLVAGGEGFAERLGAFTVKVSGCPNSCGQHHVGDIGMTGHTVKESDGVERPYYSILIGGSVGETTARVGKRIGRFREDDAPAAIAAIARWYESDRTTGETFPQFVDRVGLEQVTEVANAAVGSRA